MIFTLTDRQYNPLDAYETSDYVIGKYIGSIINSLDINVLTNSENADKWIEGNYIMCEDAAGYKYWFTIYDAEDSLSDTVKMLKCYSGSIDILAEDAPQVGRPSTPQPFKYYFDKVFYDTGVTIGINEISDLSRSLEFESESVSNAEMLQYVLNGFDGAEADLAVEFNGSIPVSLVLNVFKRIGSTEVQSVLSDEDNSLSMLDRTGSISNLATCINPEGGIPEGKDDPVSLLGKYFEEKDENGEIAYYSPANSHRVFSINGRKMFYVELPGKTNGEFDGYINRKYVSEAVTQTTLWNESLAQLKKIDHPIVEYEAKGYIECNIGDNVQILSNIMRPPVLVSARVLEYQFNDDDPSRNEYTFGNYLTLKSNMDQLTALMDKIKKSVITITSQTVDYAIGTDSINPPIVGWVGTAPEMHPGDWLWTRTTTVLSNGDTTVGYSISYAGNDGADGPKGDDGLQGPAGLPGPEGTSSYVHIAYANSSNGVADFSTTDSTNKLYIGMCVDNDELDPSTPSSYNWTLVKGSDGSQGIPGVKGADGRTPYVHFAYATNANGTDGFSITDSLNKPYIGQYTDFTAADSTDPSKYKWTLIKGSKGDDGLRGLQGEQGEQGIPGVKGADGKTQYTHIAYANSADGASGFSVSDSLNKLYIGMYVDFKATDSPTPSEYNWTLIKGADGSQGIPGVKGADGKTQYLHIAYATNSTGSTGFSTSVSDGKTYIGQYTDFTSGDSESPSKYKWTLIKGDKGDRGDRGLQGLQGNDGAQGIPGVKGADGKTQYTHIAYATNSTGSTGFSTSDSLNKTYIGMYVDFLSTDSPNPSAYNWTLIKGADGSQGIPGVKGADGQTQYLHIAYATNSTGSTGFSTSVSDGKTYIGQYTDFTSTDSESASKYKWTLIKGDKGDKGATGAPGTNGSNGAPGAAGQNAITGYLTNESLILPANSAGTVTSYSGANGYFRVMDGNSQALTGITFSLVSATSITTTITSAGYFAVTAITADVGTATYRAVYKGVTVEKIIMVVKNKQGPTGATGSPGTKGATGSTGPKGDPTGITQQASVPVGPYVGMLWKNTGAAGYIKDVTYRWNGSKWEIFVMSVENLSVSNLAAISANLGTVTAGKISGSGINGSVTIDANSGMITSEASDDFITSRLDAFGGRIKSVRKRKSINDYTVGSFDGFQIGLEAFTPQNVVYQSTFIQPGGFVNFAEGSTRVVEFSKEGMILSPAVSNTGTNLNSGIELKGNISYIDFHNSATSAIDYGARIWLGSTWFGTNRLIITNPKDDVNIHTFGNLHVKDADGDKYKQVRASAFSQQSAHSAKQDFENVDTKTLLDAIVYTDIVKYRMKSDLEAIKKTVGFVINDDGLSPYYTSDLLINDDNSSFNTTTAIGTIFGAIKELNAKIKKLEELL